VRQAPDYFGDEELLLVYIAKKLKEAQALEEVLTEGGIDYAVEPDRYRGGFLFASERVGAFFYVREEVNEETRELMRTKGYKPYIARGNE
jgi:hypothetical protein